MPVLGAAADEIRMRIVRGAGCRLRGDPDDCSNGILRFENHAPAPLPLPKSDVAHGGGIAETDPDREARRRKSRGRVFLLQENKLDRQSQNSTEFHDH